jgi:hypothetical protein
MLLRNTSPPASGLKRKPSTKPAEAGDTIIRLLSLTPSSTSSYLVYSSTLGVTIQKANYASIIKQDGRKKKRKKN